MELHEYQAKHLLTKYNIPIPEGYVCSTAFEAKALVSKINCDSWVIKCQIHAGGRGKSGGIKVAKSKDEVFNFAKKWLGKRLITYQTDTLGKEVNFLLIEANTDIKKELYLGAIIDRNTHRVMFMASEEGGVEIEKIAKDKPSLIHKILLDPLTGPQFYQGRSLAFKIGLENQQIDQFSNIFVKLATLFLEQDVEFLEINPLVITNNKDLICLDAKMSIDNNALFRHPELLKMRDYSQEDKLEIYANQCKLNYVTLDGNIAIIVNGAGLAMGIMDLIKLYGGKPANFLDVGGSVTEERVTEAFKIILSNNKVKVILINIFGGIVRCDLIANGIINAILDIKINIPIVIRLEGNNAKLGIKLLINSGLNIITASSLHDAVQKSIDNNGD